MNSGRGGPFDVCSSYSGQDRDYCESLMGQCLEQEAQGSAGGGAKKPIELTACNQSKFQIADVPACMRMIPRFISAFSSCAVAKREKLFGMEIDDAAVEALVKGKGQAIVVAADPQDARLPAIARALAAQKSADQRIFFVDGSTAAAYMTLVYKFGILKRQEINAAITSKTPIAFGFKGDAWTAVVVAAGATGPAAAPSARPGATPPASVAVISVAPMGPGKPPAPDAELGTFIAETIRPQFFTDDVKGKIRELAERQGLDPAVAELRLRYRIKRGDASGTETKATVTVGFRESGGREPTDGDYAGMLEPLARKIMAFFPRSVEITIPPAMAEKVFGTAGSAVAERTFDFTYPKKAAAPATTATTVNETAAPSRDEQPASAVSGQPPRIEIKVIAVGPTVAEVKAKAEAEAKAKAEAEAKAKVEAEAKAKAEAEAKAKAKAEAEAKAKAEAEAKAKVEAEAKAKAEAEAKAKAEAEAKAKAEAEAKAKAEAEAKAKAEAEAKAKAEAEAKAKAEAEAKAKAEAEAKAKAEAEAKAKAEAETKAKAEAEAKAKAEAEAKAKAEAEAKAKAEAEAKAKAEAEAKAKAEAEAKAKAVAAAAPDVPAAAASAQRAVIWQLSMPFMSPEVQRYFEAEVLPRVISADTARRIEELRGPNDRGTPAWISLGLMVSRDEKKPLDGPVEMTVAIDFRNAMTRDHPDDEDVEGVTKEFAVKAMGLLSKEVKLTVPAEMAKKIFSVVVEGGVQTHTAMERFEFDYSLSKPAEKAGGGPAGAPAAGGVEVMPPLIPIVPKAKAEAEAKAKAEAEAKAKAEAEAKAKAEAEAKAKAEAEAKAKAEAEAKAKAEAEAKVKAEAEAKAKSEAEAKAKAEAEAKAKAEAEAKAKAEAEAKAKAEAEAKAKAAAAPGATGTSAISRFKIAKRDSVPEGVQEYFEEKILPRFILAEVAGELKKKVGEVEGRPAQLSLGITIKRSGTEPITGPVEVTASIGFDATLSRNPSETDYSGMGRETALGAIGLMPSGEVKLTIPEKMAKKIFAEGSDRERFEFDYTIARPAAEPADGMPAIEPKGRAADAAVAASVSDPVVDAYLRDHVYPRFFTADVQESVMAVATRENLSGSAELRLLIQIRCADWTQRSSSRAIVEVLFQKSGGRVPAAGDFSGMSLEVAREIMALVPQSVETTINYATAGKMFTIEDDGVTNFTERRSFDFAYRVGGGT